MSFVATRWAWNEILAPNSKLVLLCLAKFSNDEHQCWPSQSTIAQQTGINVEDVREAIKALKEHGLMTSERGDRRMIYTLKVEVAS